MEETLSLQEILKIMKKRVFLIVSLMIVTICIAAVVSFYFLKPIYEAQTQLLINQKVSSEQVYSWSQIETDLQLINTYNEIIESPFILNKVIEELTLNTTLKDLTKQITLSSENNSKVLNIEVEDSNRQQAAKIANVIANTFKEEVPSLMNVDNITILSAAKVSDIHKPVKPNKLVNIAIGVVFGLVLGIGIAILLEVVDTTIKDEKDVEQFLGIPVIGLVDSIPLEKVKKAKKSSFRAHQMRGNQDAWVEK